MSLNKTILVTGFDDFLEHQQNPSWEIAKALDQTEILGYAINSIKLSVCFDECGNHLISAIELYKPQIIICLGLAANRSCISVERVAINIDDAIAPDQNNNQPIDRRIINNAAPAYFSSLPIKSIYKTLLDHKIPVEISNSAGTYVCNHLFFHLMHYVNCLNDAEIIQAGFIHVPLINTHTQLPQSSVLIKTCSGPVFHSIDLKIQIRAIQLSLEHCIKQANPSSGA